MGKDGSNVSSREMFQRVRARLRAAVGEDVYSSWFARLELEEIVDDLAHLSVPTRFLCSWVQSNYSEKILEAFRAELAALNRLHFTVRVNGQARPRLPQADHEAEAEDSGKPSAVPAAPRLIREPLAAHPATRGDALSGSAIDPKMTFDTFVSGASNEMALQVAKQVAHAAANNAVSFNPVYIHSSVGLGKSHLLNAIAWAAGAAEPGRNIVYLTADHFMYHFITAVQRQSALGFKEWLRRVDLLRIVDMQFLQGKSASEFGHTLGTLLTGAKQVVVAGDAPPRDLEMLDERVRSRLSGGLVVPINTFDADLRKAIVTRRAEQATLRFADAHFPPAVIDYVARVVVSHGRDLDGAVNRLLAANQLTKEPITVSLAERTLAAEAERTWQVLRGAAREAGDWITVDSLAHPYAIGIAAEPFRWAELELLVYSPSRWERRLVGSTIATLTHGAPGRRLGAEVVDRGLPILGQLMGDAEPDVQKSLSWAYRSLAAVDQDATTVALQAQADLAVATGDGHRAWVIRDSLTKLAPTSATALHDGLVGIRKRPGAPSTSTATATAGRFGRPSEATLQPIDPAYLTRSIRP